MEANIGPSYSPGVMAPSSRLSSCVLVALCSWAIAAAALAQPSATQVINLVPGWNLVSLQVGNGPLPVASFRDALLQPERLIEIWGYVGTGDPAVPGHWDSYQPQAPRAPPSPATRRRRKGA